MFRRLFVDSNPYKDHWECTDCNMTLEQREKHKWLCPGCLQFVAIYEGQVYPLVGLKIESPDRVKLLLEDY